MPFHRIFQRLTGAALAAVCLSTHALGVPIPGQGTWETELQARDLDHNGVTDAYYDTELNITWFADAYPLHDQTTFFDRVNWSTARRWVDNFSFGGFNDWRMPMMAPANGSSWNFDFSLDGSTDNGFNNTRTELGHLMYVTLGNTSPCAPSADPTDCVSPWPPDRWPQENSGPFRFWPGQLGDQWMQTPDGGCAVMDIVYRQISCGDTVPAWADEGGAYFFAVRSGDITSVPAVPEPSSLLLALAGAVVLGLWHRRGRLLTSRASALLRRALLGLGIAVAGAGVQAVPVVGQGTWQTTLQARDLDGNGVTDSFYDTALNVTWYANADPVLGPTSWRYMHAWLDQFSLGGGTDWRLPSMAPLNGVSWNMESSFDGSTDTGYYGTHTEMGHLYYVTLGNYPPCGRGSEWGNPDGCVPQWPNGARPPENTGSFQNLSFAANTYVMETPDGNCGLMGDPGWQSPCSHPDSPYSYMTYVSFMAVHDGDLAGMVPSVPEPSSVALAIAGAGVLFGMRRRRRGGVSPR